MNASHTRRSSRGSRGRLLVAGAACVLTFALGLGAEEPKVDPPSYNRMTDAEEVALGREASAAYEKDQKLAFVTVPAVQNYVGGLITRIAAQSRRSQLTYSTKVLDTMVVNASAWPGGFVYVNRGIIEWARSESELVGVLSHEIGHVAGRHGANNLARMTSAESLILEASSRLLGTPAPALILKQIGGPVAFMALMKYSRTDELQADLLGFYNMQRAGWNPDGMVELFKHMGDRSSPMDSILSMTQSHPAAADRVSQITNEMKLFPPKGELVRDSAEFKAVQAELKKLPKPSSSN
jgi:beta-barrel assembly-enhancing protease